VITTTVKTRVNMRGSEEIYKKWREPIRGRMGPGRESDCPENRKEEKTPGTKAQPPARGTSPARVKDQYGGGEVRFIRKIKREHNKKGGGGEKRERVVRIFTKSQKNGKGVHTRVRGVSLRKGKEGGPVFFGTDLWGAESLGRRRRSRGQKTVLWRKGDALEKAVRPNSGTEKKEAYPHSPPPFREKSIGKGGEGDDRYPKPIIQSRESLWVGRATSEARGTLNGVMQGKDKVKSQRRISSFWEACRFV